AASRAMPAPLMPPPTTSRSKRSLMRHEDNGRTAPARCDGAGRLNAPRLLPTFRFGLSASGGETMRHGKLWAAGAVAAVLASSAPAYAGYGAIAYDQK